MILTYIKAILFLRDTTPDTLPTVCPAALPDELSNQPQSEELKKGLVELDFDADIEEIVKVNLNSFHVSNRQYAKSKGIWLTQLSLDFLYCCNKFDKKGGL